MIKRHILHLDVDAFFASVEEILDPSLKGKPLIVGARPEQRGVEAEAVSQARDRVREKYGDEAIWRASLVKSSHHNENGGGQ